jgi:hypothetical protein
MDDLKNGILSPFLNRVLKDTTLELEIRNDAFNVYYRGGNIFRLSKSETKCYKVSFDESYASTIGTSSLELPPSRVTNLNDSKEWVATLPHLKDVMDLWFGKHPKDERALQQLVAWENNSSPWAKSTDYFVIDIEYNNRKGARFDLVALRWDSTPHARGLRKGYTPKLAIIEMKAGDGAVKDKSGIVEHCEKARRFLGSPEQVDQFQEEMLCVFKQKRELGLIKALKDNNHSITMVDKDVEFMFLFVGHDPASSVMRGELSKIGDASFKLKVCLANFMGFALYEQGVYSLEEFKKRNSL